MNRETASIFNSAIAASAISAAFELGLFDELRRQGSLSVDEFCQANNLHRQSLVAVLLALHGCRVVALDPSQSVAEPGPVFEQAYADKGYFSWLTGGYGQMLQNLASMVRRENRTGEFTGRNGRRIAWAGRDYGAHFVDRHFDEMLAETPFTVAADIGCGSGERLVQLAQSRQDFRGVGIEINHGAAELARESVRRAGLQDRITVLHGNVQDSAGSPECSEVDLIFSFFMGHDLWPREDCLRALAGIRRLFPRAQRFLLCDTYRSDALGNGQVPIFTLGFELTHAVMGQFVPSRSEWLDLFADSPWKCVGQRTIDIPHSCIFDLR